MAIYIGNTSTGAPSSMAGVDKELITSVRIAVMNMTRDLATKLVQQRNLLQLVAGSSGFKGQTASALSNHIRTRVVPIINNAIEACALLNDEAQRIQSAYNSLDHAGDAVIRYDEVEGAISRMKMITAGLKPAQESLRSICSRAAELGCSITPVGEGNMKRVEAQYIRTCRTLVETSKRYDMTLTGTISTLKENMKRIAQVAHAAQRNIQARIASQDSDHQKDIDTLAWRVIRGDFGNGQDRKNALGEDYDEVQERVNELWDVSGKPKPGVTPPEHIDELSLGEYRARRATSDPILGQQWNTPIDNLPFDGGSPGEVEDRFTAKINTDDLGSDGSGWGVYIDPSIIRKKDPNYSSHENTIADPRASRLFPVTPEQAQGLQSYSIRQSESGQVFGIDLAKGSQTLIDLNWN